MANKKKERKEIRRNAKASGRSRGGANGGGGRGRGDRSLAETSPNEETASVPATQSAPIQRGSVN